MVVIASREGMFANRVIHFANIYAFCKANNVKLHHLHFRDYISYFPELKRERSVSIAGNGLIFRWANQVFLVFIKVFIKLGIRNLGFLELIHYECFEQNAPIINLDEGHFAKKAKRKILVLYGWLFRAPKHFTREEPEIRKVFSLPKEDRETANVIIGEIRKDFEIVVGVHVRRGDYIWFEKGRWYYENEVYKDKMMCLYHQFVSKNKKVAFVICSNEAVNLTEFDPLPVFNYQKGFAIDFLLLSLTDYIIGPPSTFSALASYWGKRPLQHIATKEDILRLSSFKIVERP
jgi:hypothetical protein